MRLEDARYGAPARFPGRPPALSGDGPLLCYLAKHRPCSPCVLPRTLFLQVDSAESRERFGHVCTLPWCYAAHPHLSGSGPHGVQPTPASMVCVSKLRVRGTCDDCHRAEILGFNSELYTAIQVKYSRRLKSERCLDPLHAIRGQYVPGPSQPCQSSILPLPEPGFAAELMCNCTVSRLSHAMLPPIPSVQKYNCSGVTWIPCNRFEA